MHGPRLLHAVPRRRRRPPAWRTPPPRAIFTRKALDSTALFSDTLLGARTFAVDQLASSVGWVTGVSVIAVSGIVGVCALLSLLRTYQETAQLPATRCCECAQPAWRLHGPRMVPHGAACSIPVAACCCMDLHGGAWAPCAHPLTSTLPRLLPPAAPGRVSLGAYLTLISAGNFGVWLTALVVALLIGAQLCWLLLAFMFEAALVRGVT